MGLSKGAQKLEDYLREIFGHNIPILREYPVGDRLRLDFYIPDLKIGFEYHGIQHSTFNSFFYKDEGEFREAKKRDVYKAQFCAEQNIAFVEIWHYEDLTKDLVLEKAEEALKSFALIKTSTEESPYDKAQREYHTQRLEKARKKRKERYQFLKSLKDKLNVKTKKN